MSHFYLLIANRFRLVELQLKYILNEVEPRKMIAALSSVPTGLPEAYTDVFQRIERKGEGRINLVMKILSWILHAYRPFRMAELRDAISVEIGDTRIEEDYLLEPAFIVEACESLVAYNETDGRVRFSHYTVQEFLERGDIRTHLLSVGDFATICLTYLAFDVFEGPRWESLSVADRRQVCPFGEYATRHWIDYTRGEGEKAGDVQLSFLRFFQSKNNHKKATLLAGCWGRRKPSSHDCYLIALHIAANYDLATLCNVLLQREKEISPACDMIRREFGEYLDAIDIDQQDHGIGRTALHLAVKSGSIVIVRSLLEAGAKVNIQNRLGHTPLHEALYYKRAGLVEPLMAAGADPRIKDFEGVDAVALAKGDAEILKYLLQKRVV
jgi:Ankyrin repeats (3 copies)